MKNHEINPDLKKIMESLQDVPARNPQASQAGRENYLAQVKSLQPRPVSSQKAPRRRQAQGRRGWAVRLGTIAAVLLVALSSLGGTVYAAQAAQPDDLLYGVKTLTEEIQVSLEGDPGDKLDLYVSFANRRLQEIQNQLAEGEQVSEKALDLLEKHTRKMLEQAASLEGGNMEKALRQIETNLQKQNQMMAELGKEHPQDSPPGLLKAQEKIRERLELVENGIKQPQGFKEKIEQQKENSENPGKGKGNENGNPDAPGMQDDTNNQNIGTVTPGSGSGYGPGGK